MPTKTKKAALTVTVTLAKFDLNGVEPVYRPMREGIAIGDYVPLTIADYVPRGSTPLRDATAHFIAHLDRLRSKDSVTIGLLADESGSMFANRTAVVAGINEFVAGMADVKKVDPKSAGTVLAVILTDGYENASREIDQPTLAKTIADHEADGFTFIFLGASHDAWEAGMSLGFSGSATGQTVSTTNSPTGTYAAMLNVTDKGVGYLSDNAEFTAVAAASPQYSVTEDGAELDTNINAPIPKSAEPYADAADALKTAKGKLS